MPILGKSVAVAAASLIMLGLGPASSSIASSRVAGATRPVAGASLARAHVISAPEVRLAFTVNNLPAGGILIVHYSTSVLSSRGGTATSRAGGIGTVGFLANALVLAATGASALDADVTDFLSVNAPEVTGTAKIPAGATVTVTNTATRQTISLAGGPFSIPVGTGVGATGSKDVIFSPRLAPGVAITGPASSGQPVELAANTGSPAQIWTITNPGNPSDTTIVNQQTGLCLDAVQHAAGAKVIAATCTGSQDQQWTESGVTNGSWRLSYGLTRPILQAAVSVGTSNVLLAPLSTTDGNLLDWLERSPA
jgi:hypothetical protein